MPPSYRCTLLHHFDSAQSSRALAFQHVIPPLTEMSWPVIHRLFSLAKNNATSETSSTVPGLSSALVMETRMSFS